MSKNDSTNFVLHAKSDQFYWEGIGQLSIKTFSNGKAHYKTNKGMFAVEESRYLPLIKVHTQFQLMKRRMWNLFVFSLKMGLKPRSLIH